MLGYLADGEVLFPLVQNMLETWTYLMNVFDIATCGMLCVRSKYISCVVPDYSIQPPIYLLADFLLKKSVELMCCRGREKFGPRSFSVD